MRSPALILSLLILAATAPVESRAGDAETIAEVNKAAAALDEAFEQQNIDIAAAQAIECALAAGCGSDGEAKPFHGLAHLAQGRLVVVNDQHARTGQTA